MIWQANDSEHDSEPFNGFGFSDQQKIPYFKGAKRQSGRQLQRKENLFRVKTNVKQTENIIQWTKHAKEKFKCEYHKSINKVLFGVGAVMI